MNVCLFAYLGSTGIFAHGITNYKDFRSGMDLLRENGCGCDSSKSGSSSARRHYLFKLKCLNVCNIISFNCARERERNNLVKREGNNVRKGNKGVCEDVAFTYGLDVRAK